MKHLTALGILLATVLALPGAGRAATMAEVIAASSPKEWRAIDPKTTLVMTLVNGGEVLIELAPNFAPNTTKNILGLAQRGYFDGLVILRVQDNYVTQWGDPAAGSPGARSQGGIAPTLAPEWTRPRKGLDFSVLKDGDVYAREVGISHGMPAARDKRAAWLTHCYGMVGVGRDSAPDSGNGSELYVVIGHSPRHLDRNITLAGRVIMGMENLAALPRGSGALGFYQGTEPRLGIRSVRISAQLPGDGPAARLEALREDSKSFAALTDARRNRTDDWTKVKAGKIEICNVPLPVRVKP